MIKHEERLLQVHPDLANFIYDLCGKLEPRHKDWLIICGWRPEADQHAAFLAGTSTKDWPDGKHNHMVEIIKNVVVDGVLQKVPEMIPLSLAVDISPHPYDRGKDKGRLYIISGFAMALAEEQGLKIRCGADWNGNLSTTDQKLHDLFHYELVLA